MFKGQYDHQLDPKGRVALPAAFKRELLDRGDDLLVVTPHLEGKRLVAYPKSEWARFEERVAALPQFDPNVVELRLRMVGRAMDCPIDKVGRINLPGWLREAARIESELVWVGQLRWLEIWSRAELEKVAPLDASVPVSPATVAKLAELGL